MLLKSLVYRSLRYTFNSGDGLSRRRAVAHTVSSMSEMTSKVLGPEEQPRSAMPMLSVQVEHTVLTMASLVAALDREIMVFYTKQQDLRTEIVVSLYGWS